MFNDAFGFQGRYPSREVTVQRVVNVVSNRNPGRPQGFNYVPNQDQWCNNVPQRFRNSPEHHWEDDFQDFRNFQEAPFVEPRYAHDDLRHHLSGRGNGRPAPYFRNRGGFTGNFQREESEAFRLSSGKTRSRKKKTHPGKSSSVQESPPKKSTPKPTSSPAASRSGSAMRSVKDKKCVPVQAAASSSTSKEAPVDVVVGPSSPDPDPAPDPAPVLVHTTSVEAKETLPEETSGSPTDDAKVVPSLTARTPVEESKSSAPAQEVPSASKETAGEPEPTPADDLRTRRADAIRTKALEIEEIYRQDCETFCSVVQLLVDKEPSLETLLQAPLDKNLLEIKQQCMEDLQRFVKELDDKSQVDSSV